MRPSGLKENLKKVFWKKNGASTRTEKGNVLPEMAPKPMFPSSSTEDLT